MSGIHVAVALGRGPGTKASNSTARTAAQLFNQRRVDLIVMSGRWSHRAANAQTPHTEAAGMKETAMTKYHVPANKILIEDGSQDTISNMTKTRRLLAETGITEGEITIITIPHAKQRALLLACWAFGMGWKITVVESDYDFPTPGEERRVRWYERVYCLVTRGLLAGVQPGDLETLEGRLRIVHPGYRPSHAYPTTLS